MKEVILSADNKAKVYLVPDEVADHLDDFCWEFSAHWIWNDPNGMKLLQEIHGQKVACFNEADFIAYLNTWRFPEQPSVLVKELDYYDYELPAVFRDYPQFNF